MLILPLAAGYAMPDTPSVEDKIIALKHSYIRSLPDKFLEINRHWQHSKTQHSFSDKCFEASLHKLAGSAGMYDEAALGELCRSLELMAAGVAQAIDTNTIRQLESGLLQLDKMISDLLKQ
ncbi:MAG: Hpt domain-containing protein [Gammaproteobacteria bacterium]|nr:Hpt domain-containing protein [Gammaproteobacteria bacterium]